MSYARRTAAPPASGALRQAADLLAAGCPVWSLAESLCCPRGTVRDWLRGRRPPADIYRVAAGWLRSRAARCLNLADDLDRPAAERERQPIMRLRGIVRRERERRVEFGW